MTLGDLIRRFRVLADDKEKPYFWSDEDIAEWLNDAQAQACVRGRLLPEDANPAICEVAVTAGQHTYKLHPTVYELVRTGFRPAALGGRPCKFTLVSREWLDANYPDWRDADDWSRTEGGTRYLVQNDTTVRIVPTPTEDGTLTIEAYRLPLKKLSADNDAASPEIHAAHHEHLLLWALHKAFSVPDAELIDPARAQKAEEGFTAYFGPMPDSDLRRITREDVAHHNEAILP